MNSKAYSGFPKIGDSTSENKSSNESNEPCCCFQVTDDFEEFFSNLYNRADFFARIRNVFPEITNHSYIRLTFPSVLGFCFTSVTDCMFLGFNLYLSTTTIRSR